MSRRKIARLPKGVRIYRRKKLSEIRKQITDFEERTNRENELKIEINQIYERKNK